MRGKRAFVIGMIAGVVMSALLWVARAALGIPETLETMLGTMWVEPGPTAWMVGFVMHLLLSGLIAMLYALAFEHIAHRSGWLVGAGFGLVHAIIAGMVMGMMPGIHPRMPGAVTAPGAYMSGLGTLGVVLAFAVHVAYGAVVGALYGPAVHHRFEIGDRRAVGA